jgi:hypothetical protein
MQMHEKVALHSSLHASHSTLLDLRTNGGFTMETVIIFMLLAFIVGLVTGISLVRPQRTA